jgi:hypothetical protein
MSLMRIMAAAGAVLLYAASASAQLPIYNLPSSDFRWTWGTANPERQHGTPDLEVSGSEAAFNCDLTARLMPASSMSRTDISAIENELRTRLDFVYAVSQTMYNLEQSRYIMWAVLDCKKYEPTPSTPEQRAERESEARDKMLRELERRRARARDD